MAIAAERSYPSTEPVPAGPLLGEAPPSPAGALEPGAMELSPPPLVEWPMALTLMRFSARPLQFLFGARRRLGETFAFRVPQRPTGLVVTSHPDHARALFTAPYQRVPSLTASSPLRPIVGESVLTLNGDPHMRRRKLLLPPFHGDAIARYTRTIEALIEREIDRWEVGRPFALAKRMQAVTLDVIMAGVFGVDGRGEPGSPERALRDVTRRMLGFSNNPAFTLLELRNVGRLEARGVMRRLLELIDERYYAVISARRARPARDRGQDVLSLLLEARDEDGRALTDREIRDELITLVLAGHETTANSLAWAFERLTRFPAAHQTLKDLVRRDDSGAAAYVEATVYEAMRVRPVIPMVGRLVRDPWQLGEHVIPSDTPVSAAIILIHHREDLYPNPFAFLPERFLGVKPGTYTWLPFGGGTRRCLGATLALAEQRIVLRAIARRVDLAAPTSQPEPVKHRNVTLVPRDGGRVAVARRL